MNPASRLQSIRPFTKALVASLLAALSFPAALAQPASRQPVLLALSKTDHTLAIVDSGTLKVLARVPVGSDPHEVIASADGKVAYVSIYGGGQLHELDRIDLVHHKVLPSIDTLPLRGPHGLDFVGGKLWFTVEGSKAIARYDPATGHVDWIMGTGQNRTHMIHVNADEKTVYVTNVASGTVSILESVIVHPPAPAGHTGEKAHEDWTETVIPVSQGSEGFDITPDGKELWTASAADGHIYVIDLVAKKLKATIDAKVLGANRLKITPDGKFALISSLKTGDLFFFDLASRKLVKKISLGHGAAGILISQDGTKAYVGCTADDYVAVVDVHAMQVVGKLNVGGGPDGLAWANRP